MGSVSFVVIPRGTHSSEKGAHVVLVASELCYVDCGTVAQKDIL
jgi:hypothetical protein